MSKLKSGTFYLKQVHEASSNGYPVKSTSLCAPRLTGFNLKIDHEIIVNYAIAYEDAVETATWYSNNGYRIL